jgi:hypothetical protein
MSHLEQCTWIQKIIYSYGWLTYTI